MRSRFSIVALGWVAVLQGLGPAIALVLAPAPPCAAAPSGAPSAPRFVVEGVPFVSWSDATRLDYPDKDVLNPSVAAAFAMISRYWGQDSITELMRDENQSWGRISRVQNASLDDLKDALRTHGPLVVTPALTPWAHPLPDSVLMMMQAGVVKAPRQVKSPPTSRLLGTLASFKTIKRIRLPVDPFQEAFRMAARVVIGYDDQRSVVLLHDPSFGPALEMSYADFGQMWRAAGASYMTLRPRDPAAVPVPSVEPGPGPSPEQQALRRWVDGYALASIGRIDEAAQEYRRGLEIADIGIGSRHVLLVELALCHRENGDQRAAIELARRATEALPEHSVGWMLLGNLYAESSLESRGELSRQYTSEAERLRADLEAREIVAKTLPRDIRIGSSADTAFAAEREGEGTAPQSTEREDDRQDERLLQMEFYSLTLPDEDGWRVEKPLCDPLGVVVLQKELGGSADPTEIQIQLITGVITEQSYVRKSGKENADNIFGLEQKTMREQGVERGLYELRGVSTGEEEVAGRHFFFMDYEAELAAEVLRASLYLFFPQERHNKWFLMVHYRQAVPKTTGLSEQAKASLLEVLSALEIRDGRPRVPVVESVAGTPPPSYRAGLGSIAVSIKSRAPLQIGPLANVAVVLFAKLEAGEDGLASECLVASNFHRKKHAFLLNAEPGRYVAVAGLFTGPSGAPVFQVFFSEDLIRQTEVTVEPDQMTFIGDFVVKYGLRWKSSDGAQRHYSKRTSPGGSHSFARFLSEYIAVPSRLVSAARGAATEAACRELARTRVFRSHPDWLAVIDGRRAPRAGHHTKAGSPPAPASEPLFPGSFSRLSRSYRQAPEALRTGDFEVEFPPGRGANRYAAVALSTAI